MRIYKSPQVRDDGKRLVFEFSGEMIIVSLGGLHDIFDFTLLPDGETDISTVETILPFNPIISAKRVDGVLSVEILNFISEDASIEEKFPEWEEV